MTITLPLQPEYPTESSDLSKWLGPRRSDTGEDALSRLRSEDAEGLNGIYANRAEQAARVKRCAELIGLLWGIEYETANGQRGPMRQAGRQILLECKGNLEEVEELYRAMDKDPVWRGPCEKCQSAYSVARRMSAFRAKRRPEQNSDYLEGKTADEWAEERRENESVRQAALTKHRQAQEEMEKEKEERRKAAEERWKKRWETN